MSLKSEPMKIAAHRGYSGRYPENTMLAFQKALEAGADEIELDVQLSKDGHVMVFHDESLDRLTGQKSYIRDLYFDEIKKLNVAYGPHGSKFGFNPVPSLDDYFNWVKNTEIVTNIELKNGVFYYEGLEEKTIALVLKYNLEEKIFFSSFNHVSLIKCKKQNPRILCGVLTDRTIANAGYYVRSNGLDFYHPVINSLNDEAVASCCSHEVGINVWTVNDMPGLLRTQSWNCRGIITDFPDVCKTWISGRRT